MDNSLPTNIFISDEGFDYEIIDRIDCTASLKDENGELNIPQVTEKSFRVVFTAPSLSTWQCQDKGIVNVYNIENEKSLFLQDENDNLPIFDMSEYTFTVSESVLVGTIIGKVRATDVDITDNIRYRFSNSDKLDIDSITGEITLKALLDFEDGFLFKIYGSKISFLTI